MNTSQHIDPSLIRTEQIKGILQQSPVNLRANTLAVILSFIIFSQPETQNYSKQQIWLSFMLLLSFFQWIEIRKIGRENFTQSFESRLQNGSLVLAFILGISWSFFIFLFTSNDTESIYLMAVLVCGLIAGSTTSISTYLPLYFLFTLPLIASLFTQLFISGNNRFIYLGGLITIYYATCSNMALLLNKRELESFSLRFKNLDGLKKLEQQKQIAEKANIAKSKFLAATSHDLRQPLHALSFFVDAVKSETGNEHPLFEKIEASINNLKGLFDALLDISRLDAGVILVNNQHFHIKDTFNTLRDEFLEQAKSKSIELKFESGECVLYSDPELLKRLLDNLISNAIRYTKKGCVTVSLSKHEQSCVICVKDTGVGISQEDQSKIFEEFYQLNNPERDRTKGLGLGLAIVKKLSLLLQSKLIFDSSVGVGSRFCLELKQGDEKKIKQQTPTINYQNRSLQGVRILFIDDEIDIRKAIQHSLTNWGCEVICAESLDDALGSIAKKQFEYDLVISDLRLRDGTGIEAINELFKTTGRKTPAILVSGDTSKESINKANDSGYPLLYKPLRPAELRLRLINLLD